MDCPRCMGTMSETKAGAAGQRGPTGGLAEADRSLGAAWGTIWR